MNNGRIMLLCLCVMASVAICGDLKSGVPNLKMGVVSDVHILANGEGGFATEDWEKALRWFDAKQVDAVVCAGDMAQNAMVKEFQAFAETWFKVFPDNCAADGRHVEPVFVYGNHDLDGWVFGVDQNDKEAMAAQFERSIAKDPAGTWQSVMHEDYGPCFIKDVKGYKFLCLHWGEEGRIADALAQNEEGLKNEKMFFVVQHPVFKDTVNCSWVWGQDEGAGSAALESYPNAVAFCGHSHMPLNDETSIWQDDFTVIGTSSMREVEGRRGRENRPYWGAPVAQMPQIGGWCYEMHGMLVNVYDDCLVIERMSFKGMPEKLSEDWVVPWPNDRSFSYKRRKAEFARHLPAFDEGAKDRIAIRKISGQDEKGVPVEQVVVEFPTALAGKFIPMDYEVRAEKDYVDLVNVYRTKRVYAPGVWKSDAFMRGVKTGTCVFGAFELPMDCRMRFVITPIDYFGNRGESISSETVIPGNL